MENKDKIFVAIISIFAFVSIYAATNIVYDSAKEGANAKKVIRAYNEINAALYDAQKNYGNFNEWVSDKADDKEKIEIFMHNLKIDKKIDCGINNPKNICWWSDDILNNNKNGVSKPAKYSYTFKDKHNNNVYVFKDNHWGYLMVYDINGNEPPNMRGEDIFYFQTGPENIEFVPGGEEQLSSNKKLETGCFQNGYCAAWVVRTGNMEYLKTENGVCPNGKHLSWYNKTCK